MKMRNLVAVAAVSVLFLASFALQAYAQDGTLSSLPGLQPGVGEVISTAYDGQTVFLPAVVISRIHLRGGVVWWRVRDSEDASASLTIADCAPPLAAQLQQTIDIQGQFCWVGSHPCLTNVTAWLTQTLPATYCMPKISR